FKNKMFLTNSKQEDVNKNYSPNVKAKLDLHLLLNNNNKIAITYLLDNKASEVVEIQ
ncbi:15845_t:CDS:1, partial [Cetraspora pellucida]